MKAPAPPAGISRLREALRSCWASFAFAGFFSLFLNLLLLVPALYMLQVYDRVLPSGSESTLWMLTLIAAFLFAVMGALEWVRSQILVMTSVRLDQSLGEPIHDAMFQRSLASGGRQATAQPLNDLLQLRQFLTGQGLFAFFDAPWLPVYVLVMYAFHPWLAVVAVASALVLLLLAVLNDLGTRGALMRANEAQVALSAHTQRSLRNHEAVMSMGLLPGLRARWAARQQQVLAWQARASARSALITALSKTFRIAVQSLVLGLGAYLAIRKEISAGAVIAGSILLGRALAPLDLMVGSWRGFLAARDAYQRLDKLLAEAPLPAVAMELPAPRGELVADKLVVTPSGADVPVLRGVQLRLAAGAQLAVVGASAAGKTTLVRTLLGLMPATSGTVRLDGARIDQYGRDQLGPHLGYLPQDVELLDGTVGENIARFGVVDPQAVVAAAQAAGAHEMVLRLPQGYDTVIAGPSLSAGQRQRIGLARALYGQPQLVVLDEPNANLDQEGENALAQALRDLKARGATVLIVTHRKGVLAQVDEILVLHEGQVAMQGPREKMLAALQQSAEQHAASGPRGVVAVPLRPAPGGARMA